MDIIKIAEILAHPDRVQLLKAMRIRDLTAHEASQVLQMSASATSYQLKVLTEAGFIRSHRSDYDARTIYYQYVAEAMQAYLNQLHAEFIVPQRFESSMLVVAFICRANSARSQMAEAWVRHLVPQLSVVSAGVEPSVIHPLTIEVMDEVGIDASRQVAKQIVELDVTPDIVISVCDFARLHVETYFDQKVRYHWSIVDPALIGTIEQFRLARDAIKARVEQYVRQYGLHT
jgi:ArsR family transcriptional regulator, arsenate/arsenite/antimonite-responsive transcriptional repressor / arsenate reductase (thioredoxin)